MTEPSRPLGEIPGQTLWIIWLAMFGSVFLYLMIGIMARQQGFAAQMEENVELVRWILLAVSLGETGLVFFLPLLPSFAPSFGTLSIIRWALTEAIGIYGMVLYFIGDSVWVLLIFCAWAAMQMAVLAPSRDAARRHRERQESKDAKTIVNQ